MRTMCVQAVGSDARRRKRNGKKVRTSIPGTIPAKRGTRTTVRDEKCPRASSCRPAQSCNWIWPPSRGVTRFCLVGDTRSTHTTSPPCLCERKRPDWTTYPLDGQARKCPRYHHRKDTHSHPLGKALTSARNSAPSQLGGNSMV